MSREELIALVEGVRDLSNDEDTIDDYLNTLRHELPRCKISDMIYWSTVPRTSAEIIDEALRIESSPMIALTHQPTSTDHVET